MNKQTVLPWLPAATMTAIALALAACGGGGGGSGGSPSAAMATANVAITDAPSDDYQHVWVTLTAIAFHTDPNAVWSSSDASWQLMTLPSPVTVDLAQLNNGTMNNLFNNLQLPAGTYRQMRLFLAGSHDALTNSAQQTENGLGQPLQWNDQVEYISSGTTLEAPLQIARPVQGLQLLGTFEMVAGGTLNLAVDFNLEESVVPFAHGAQTAFTMKPSLRYFDLNQSGAIVGSVDPASLCPVGAPATTCSYNLIVKAELLTADGSRHYVARATSVNPTTGQYVLFPIWANDSSGNALSYDVLVRGRNMDSFLIQSVGTSMGASPTSGATSIPQVTPVNVSEYTAQLGAALAPLTSGELLFQQTLPGNSAPYEVRWVNTDPFTGMLHLPEPLVTGPIQVAPYAASTLSFTPVTPAEGSGAYSVAANEIAYYTLSSNSVLAAPVGSSTTFTVASPTLDAGVVNGSVSGNLAFASLNPAYNQCSLVIARFASIMTSVDCTSLLATHGGAFSIANLPAGSSSERVPGAYYYAYVLLSNSASSAPATIAPMPGFIDLRSTDSVTAFNDTVIGS
jgi:hypothetical protein